MLSKLILPLGQNPLLAYFLSFMVAPLIIDLGLSAVLNRWDLGLARLVRLILTCMVVVILSRLLTTRCGIKLRL